MTKTYAIAGFFLQLVACGSSGAPSSLADGGAGAPGASPPTVEADGSIPPASADAAIPIASDAGSPPVAACDVGACASLSGVVKRTATAPQHGGKGAVYVAIFDGNPVTDATHAVVVARTLLPNEDMSAASAEVAYRVDGVPVRPAPYQVIAFLDDADAVSASNPQPASGDLISLDLSGGISGVPVTLSNPGDAPLDLPLNAAMP
jgi:hypothetical protein